MKLVISIASNNDIPKIISELAKEGYFTTRLSTTGQFLADGHTLIMSGTEDEKVGDLIAIVKENVTKRTVDISGVESTLEGTLLKKPVTVEKGGAVCFVIDVEQFIKI